MTLFYINPIDAAGAGTIDDPWGMPDLLTPLFAPGIALTSLLPGDTLYFRAGTYTINDVAGGASHTPYIHPTNSGVSGLPITLRAYPGESVTITATGQTGGGFHRPLIGTADSGPDYVRFFGFHLQASNDTTGGLVYCSEVVTIATKGVEIGYCEMIGTTLPTDGTAATDNHCLLWVDTHATEGWVHHNALHDCYGTIIHTQLVMTWNVAGTMTYEDNHIYNPTPDANAGMAIEKGSGDTLAEKTSYWRRNWFQNPGLVAFQGQLEAGAPVYSATIHFCDNVVEGTVASNGHQTGSAYNNNLLVNLYSGFAFGASSGISLGQTALELYSNVATGGGYRFDNYNYQTPEPAYSFGFFDFNLTSVAADYGFAAGIKTLAQMIALGWEAHSAVIAGLAAVYPGLGSGDYTLAPAYQTAGRNGDAVGPRVPIGGSGGILDTTRYGPAALGVDTPMPIVSALSINPGRIAPSATSTVHYIGTGTTWLSSAPSISAAGAPTADGSWSLGALTVDDNTHAHRDVTTGPTIGTVVWTDSTSSKTTTLTVARKTLRFVRRRR